MDWKLLYYDNVAYWTYGIEDLIDDDDVSSAVPEYTCIGNCVISSDLGYDINYGEFHDEAIAIFDSDP